MPPAPAFGTPDPRAPQAAWQQSVGQMQMQMAQQFLPLYLIERYADPTRVQLERAIADTDVSIYEVIRLAEELA